MSSQQVEILQAAVAGGAGGGVVLVGRQVAGGIARVSRRIGGRRKNAEPQAVIISTTSDTTNAADDYLATHAAYRAAQVRTYADRLAKGDARLREHLRRFEGGSRNGVRHERRHGSGGDQPC